MPRVLLDFSLFILFTEQIKSLYTKKYEPQRMYHKVCTTTYVPQLCTTTYVPQRMYHNYVPQRMYHNVCTTTYVPQRMYHNVWTTTYVPQRMDHNVCTTTYVPQRMYHNVCTTTYVPQGMYHNVCTTTYVPQRMYHNVGQAIFYTFMAQLIKLKHGKTTTNPTTCTFFSPTRVRSAQHVLMTLPLYSFFHFNSYVGLWGLLGHW